MDERRRSWIWIGAALLPTAAAFCLTTPVPAARGMQGHIERPSLAFAFHSFYMGEVPPVAHIPRYFDFWNVSDHPIEIIKLNPSCGCLAPRLAGDKMVYQPGEQGRFQVMVDTVKETPGEKQFTVGINYRDGRREVAEQQVAFNLVIPERIVNVWPQQISFMQTHGQPDFRELRVTDFRGQQLEITGVHSDSEVATFTVGTAQETDQGHWQTPIRIDVPGEVPQGRKISFITINTNDPEFHTIKVPMVIDGLPLAKQQIQLTSGAEETVQK